MTRRPADMAPPLSPSVDDSGAALVPGRKTASEAYQRMEKGKERKENRKSNSADDGLEDRTKQR